MRTSSRETHERFGYILNHQPLSCCGWSVDVTVIIMGAANRVLGSNRFPHLY
jgi:hypothetical protein